MYLIKSETVTAAQWPLTRMIELHHSPDGIVRLVKLKTSLTTLTRPITKLILLLISDNNNNCKNVNFSTESKASGNVNK